MKKSIRQRRAISSGLYKKELLLIEKGKQEKGEIYQKNILNEYFNRMSINENNNNRMSLALNEIIIKNNKKEKMILMRIMKNIKYIFILLVIILQLKNKLSINYGLT